MVTASRRPHEVQCVRNSRGVPEAKVQAAAAAGGQRNAGLIDSCDFRGPTKGPTSLVPSRSHVDNGSNVTERRNRDDETSSTARGTWSGTHRDRVRPAERRSRRSRAPHATACPRDHGGPRRHRLDVDRDRCRCRVPRNMGTLHGRNESRCGASGWPWRVRSTQSRQLPQAGPLAAQASSLTAGATG